jgi:glycosyltransferase involved in cell wall biosynthesis
MNTKRQDVCIQAFQQLVDHGLKGWKLVIAGGLDSVDRDYFESLQQMIGNYPIECRANLTPAELHQLYEQAAIYWHASGYEVDVNNHPESVEHFGIAVVEAMAAGAYPLVYAAGGPAEIVDHQPQYIYSSLEELVTKTKQQIQKSTKPRLDNQVQKIAQRFDMNHFKQRFQPYCIR